MRLLVIGGSGFLSGALVREALAEGHNVTIVTRGLRPVPLDVAIIRADRRDRKGFASALAREKDWDLVVDSIGYNADDARQDVDVFSGKCGHLAFVSTDFVYDPARRTVPQPENPAFYATQGYGGDKRRAEEVIQSADSGALPWTIFRPSHIYGPGSLPGCLPQHSRDSNLLTRLKNKEPLTLIGGGRLLQHPVFAPDLARTLLSLRGCGKAVGKTMNTANPDIVESRRYYEIIAGILGVKATFQEITVEKFLAENPDKAPFCCDRAYDLGTLHESGLNVPATSLEDGLHQHVLSLGDS